MPELTAPQAAERAGVSRQHLTLLIRKGVLPARREETPRGPLYWIDEEALTHWMQTRRPAGRPRTSPEGENDRNAA
jgi:excisionase family DNA binding protein